MSVSHDTTERLATYLNVLGNLQERWVGHHDDVDEVPECEVERRAGTEAVSERAELLDTGLAQGTEH